MIYDIETMKGLIIIFLLLLTLGTLLILLKKKPTSKTVKIENLKLDEAKDVKEKDLNIKDILYFFDLIIKMKFKYWYYNNIYSVDNKKLEEKVLKDIKDSYVKDVLLSLSPNFTKQLIKIFNEKMYILKGCFLRFLFCGKDASHPTLMSKPYIMGYIVKIEI